MELFQELGRSIEDRWRELDYNEELFPALAAGALGEAGLPSQVSGWDVLEWTLEQQELPKQKDVRGNFGDPPVTVFTAPRFYIDVYFWFEGTTAIHQHAFCGAFQVLMGSSIHSWYEFERREAVNVFTEIGDMSLKVCEILNVGDVQEIRSGRQYIHSLFHLDQPSATIVVRTEKSPLHMPQYSYHKPNLAIDPFYEDETTTKKLQTVSAFMRSDRENADAVITKLIEKSDFQSTFRILSSLHSFARGDRMGDLFKLDGPRARFQKFLDTAVRRHGEKGAVLPAIFQHREQEDEIVAQRNVLTQPQHRFFLALLMNVNGRDRIFSLIRQRFPDAEPLDKVLDWVYEISQTRVVGSNALNALGIDDFDDTDVAILESLLQGKDAAATLEDLHAQRADINAEQLDTRIAKLSSSVILRPLMKS
jgi:hypothetical protein